MALPTTITGAVFPSGTYSQFTVPPFISSGGNVYVIGLALDASSNTRLAAFKASDPTSSFAEIDSANRPALPSNAVEASLAVHQVGDKLHVALQYSTSAGGVKATIYARVDMATDVWETITGTDRHGVVQSAVATSSAALGTSILSVDLAVLSGGTIRVVAQGAAISNMGKNFAQVVHYESTDSGATWSAGVTVNGSTVDDYTGVRIVLPPANSDQCHILYRRATSGELYQRAISSAGTLRTQRATGITNLDVYGVSNALGFDRT